MKLFSLIFLSLLFSCQKESPERFFSKLNILTLKKQIIVSNILNINTTRTAKGGPYIPIEAKGCVGSGCTISPLKSTGIGANPNEDRTPILKYEPDHPDSNKNGYVAYPNINLDEEKQKLSRVSLAIKFLLKTMPVDHDFFFSKKAQELFSKYPALDKEYNFKKLLEE